MGEDSGGVALSTVNGKATPPVPAMTAVASIGGNWYVAVRTLLLGAAVGQMSAVLLVEVVKR